MATDAKTMSRTFFDKHRRSRLAWGGYWRLDYASTLRKVEELVPSTLVDIGCGPGGFLCAAHDRFPRLGLAGLDLSEGMVTEVRERLGDAVDAVVGDAEAMPLPDAHYDVVTCNMSIHHYPHPLAALCEMRRILVPGGHLLINDMDCVAPVRAAANWLFPRLPGGDVKMYARTEILDLMAAAGLEVEVYRKVSPFTFLCVARRPLRD